MGSRERLKTLKIASSRASLPHPDLSKLHHQVSLWGRGIAHSNHIEGLLLGKRIQGYLALQGWSVNILVPGSDGEK